MVGSTKETRHSARTAVTKSSEVVQDMSSEFFGLCKLFLLAFAGAEGVASVFFEIRAHHTGMI